VRASADAATFDVAPVPCRGYAARLRKTLSVTGNRLQFAYQLDNVGSRPMQVDEYAHNFVGLDGGLVGPGLSVRFPYPVAFEKETEFTTDLLADGNELTFRSIPEHPFFARLSNIAQQAGWQWALLRPDGTMAMCESVDCAPWRVVVWGQRHVLSVEVFITIALAPGESLKWTRLYEFRA
jgi:hypothetical protein